MKQKTLLAIAFLLGVFATANAQKYKMKVILQDGTIETFDADNVTSVVFEQAPQGAAEAIAGTYTGQSHAKAAYFDDMPTDNDSVALTANADGTVRLEYSSPTWGKGVVDNISVAHDGDYQLSATAEGTIAMPSMHGGGTNNYVFQLTKGSVDDDRSSATFEFACPSVMGGVTITLAANPAK